jgi:glycine cleavage system H protein
MMNIPADLQYTKDHEWVKIEGDIATIGVTDFAQRELGDIVFIEVDTEGEALGSGDVFGTVEAVKTVSDLFMPIAGAVDSINEALEDAPEQVNQDPYGAGWMVKIKMDAGADLSELLSADQYKEVIGE